MKRFVERQLWTAVLSLGCASTASAAGAIGHKWQAAGYGSPVADSAEVLCEVVATTDAATSVGDWTLASVTYSSDGMGGHCTDKRQFPDGTFAYSGTATFYALKGMCAAGYDLQADGSCQPRPPVQVCPVGNPIIPGTGTKTYFEPNDGGGVDVPVTLAYRSYSVYGSGAGGGQWTSNWQRSLDTSLVAYPAPPQVTVQRDDGSASTFTSIGTAWSASDTQDTLQPITDANGKTTGWQYTVVDTGAVETYDTSGKLQSVRERNGRTTTLSYNAANQLTTVTAPSGRSLGFAYDSQNRVASVTAPDGVVTSYGYNSAGMLSTITRPDGAVRQYVYEDSRFPTALTGIVDENGNRYATYAYDAQARTVSSALAGGVNQYQFQYSDNYQTTVTDPTGKTSAYSFLKQNGVLLPTSISAPCGLCGSTRQSSSYDANNNLTQEIDYNGSVTTHTYDSQKRETQRVDGSGTASARTTTTEWHKVWSLPLRIASPTKLETYSYDSNGNLTSYSETPTADSDGSQGFSAATTGSARTTNWTYTADGQVATRSGPRTDVGTSTTYVYRAADDTNSPPLYRKGDLYQIVDPLGHATTIDQYDASGRPLQMTDANGIVTTFTYSNRGWLTSQTITPASGTAQATNYSYDAVGQLTKVTLSDGSTISFSYDGAHRLTGAADSQGNSIAYSLDAMGNRTQEQAKDPSGNLARQVTRVFDSMNRPLKITVGTAS
ncbi:RHS repeat domain-containing protein [Ralstonia solanacearum]|uniref:RHS repeat domain-containing protein n=1 Tax=Ralstonia solanacearum TaxID=305 RepID=UPI00236712D3|nr:RHS repeat domain-containing protein [Ralstonia solanacearum]MDD7800607.1 RHS repeat protein [Ralstonia solanacearum]